VRKYLKFAGYLEAISCVLLFAIAMPLKYNFAIPSATKVPGLIHGILFLFYITLATRVAFEEGWGKKQLLDAYFASVFPLGTLLYDKKYLKAESEF
jgi:integral membrane protein